MLQSVTRSIQKALASYREVDSAVMSHEEGSASLILDVSDSTANGRFLDTKCGCRLAKASSLRRNDEISEMAKINLER